MNRPVIDLQHRPRASAGFYPSMALGLLLSYGAAPALAAPGSTLTIGEPQSPAILTDSTGETFEVILEAREWTRAGAGALILSLQGAGLSACSVHGPSAVVDFATGGGNYPLLEVQCGRASGQLVAIDGCRADLSAHGYLHGDQPRSPFLGMITVELTVLAGKEPNASTLRIVIHAPKGKIELSGKLEGSVVMSDCH